MVTSASDPPGEQQSRGVWVISRLKAVFVVCGVLLLSVLAADLFSFFPFMQAEESSGFAGNFWYSSALALSFVGMAASGVVYLVRTGRGVEYIDVQRPTKSSVKYMISGIAVLLALLAVFNAIAIMFEIPIAETSLVSDIAGDRQLALMFITVILLFNAPVEEFLFRNVVQKRLSEVFSTASAVLIASVLFTLLHIPGYIVTATIVEMTIPITLIFTASIVFGVVYAKTRDLTVVIGIHAAFNVIQTIPFVL